MRSKVFVVILFLMGLSLVYSVSGFAALCGNAIMEGLEECDDGPNNSDSRPNACRTDCVKAKCGDYGVDSGEECDDFTSNSDKIPNACRTNCKRAHCGDGVLDEGEECDDKNNNDYDGCSQCRQCYPPKDDFVINLNLKLCPGSYSIADRGQEGVLILNPGVEVDATDVYLYGVSPDLSAASTTSAAASLAKNKTTGSSGSTMRMTKRGKIGASSSGGSATTPSGGSATLPHPQGATLRVGTGVVMKGNDAVIHNLWVQNYRNGIKVKGTGNLLYNNFSCQNSTDIVSEKAGNFGVRDACQNVSSWQENGAAGCMNQCQ